MKISVRSIKGPKGKKYYRYRNYDKAIDIHMHDLIAFRDEKRDFFLIPTGTTTQEDIATILDRVAKGK